MKNKIGYAFALAAVLALCASIPFVTNAADSPAWTKTKLDPASSTNTGVVTTGAQTFKGRKTFADGAKIGANGAAIDASYAVTVQKDFASITAGDCATDQAVALSGVDFGGKCLVGTSSAPEAGLLLQVDPVGAGTVNLRACASKGATAVDPADRVYSIRCFMP